jgi:hypothetical protein
MVEENLLDAEIWFLLGCSIGFILVVTLHGVSNLEYLEH